MADCTFFAAAQAPGEAAHTASALGASADQACLPQQPGDACQDCSSLEGSGPAAEPHCKGRAAGRRADGSQPAGRVERRWRQHAAQPGAALRARARHQRSRLTGEELLLKLCMHSCMFMHDRLNTVSQVRQAWADDGTQHPSSMSALMLARKGPEALSHSRCSSIL